MKTGCVVVAAGRGKRAGLNYNKVFYSLAGRSVLMRTLDALEAADGINEIVLVVNEDDKEAYEALVLSEGRHSKVSKVVFGGETRRDSVFAGLTALADDTRTVLIHDAARPFLTDEIINNVINDAEKYGSGVISTEITDTVKFTNEDGDGIQTLDRSKLRRVQTPQAFDYQMLLKAHKGLGRDDMATDDAYLFEKMYGKVHLTGAKSAEENIKLTTPSDFYAAERRLMPKIRIGTGYDVHRLVSDRKLILCGVEIEYEKGLLGHSDADVATHALMDAMLGALALGDIGKHFPDSDQSYKDVSSILLLKKVNEAVLAAGYRLSNCDITIVCQKPKLAPYILKMRKTLAEALALSPDCVSVKATTTEGLGFEGAGEGISARSVVLLERTSDFGGKA